MDKKPKDALLIALRKLVSDNKRWSKKYKKCLTIVRHLS